MRFTSAAAIFVAVLASVQAKSVDRGADGNLEDLVARNYVPHHVNLAARQTIVPPPTLLPNGSRCSESAQCTSGNCQYSTCQNKQPLGGSRYKDVSCSAGSCTSGSKSRPGQCATNGTLPNGAACNQDVQCSSGLFCSAIKNYHCAPQFNSGHRCSRNAACKSNSCINRRCA